MILAFDSNFSIFGALWALAFLEVGLCRPLNGFLMVLVINLSKLLFTFYYCILIINPYIYLPICFLHNLLLCSFIFTHYLLFAGFSVRFLFIFRESVGFTTYYMDAYILRFIIHWFILFVVNWPPSYVVSFLVFF